MGDEKNPEKDFEKEKKKKLEKEPEKRESRIFIYTSDFIGSDLRRRVSFDSVKESSKP